MSETCEVAIVGGGPVGMLLGCLLARRGVDTRIYEQHLARREHSRAVGVHPPGLSALALVGAAEPLLSHGVRVREAFAFGDERALGHLRFDALAGPYPFVLTVPQSDTERIIEQQLRKLSDRVLVRGQRLLACERSGDGAVLRLGDRAGTTQHEVRARFVVGCDGKSSAVRGAAQIAYRGKPYAQHFVMADTADETQFGSAAAVFLTRRGLVESFPLPGGLRRWVVGLGAHKEGASATLVERLVAERTGQLARAATASMKSAFTAEHFLADSFAEGPFLLAGDAAHVVSPIGGQGMNLGWLDATLLAEVLARICLEQKLSSKASATLLRRYANERRRAARSATMRAELFMSIGQTRHLRALRDLAVQALLSPKLAGRAAELFAMRGLRSAPLAP
jgi:2-polyprenyl-6-methoxyphenol hydroxylase-like FAD-dependent oxidoreductase